MGARKPGGCTITLPRHLMAQLLVYCGERREQPADVVADLVALHLDECGPRFDFSPGARGEAETLPGRQPPARAGVSPTAPRREPAGRSAQLRPAAACAGENGASPALGAPPPAEPSPFEGALRAPPQGDAPVDIPAFLRRRTP